MQTGTLILTESHILNSSELFALTSKAKDLYNSALYVVRQSFCKPNELRHESKMIFYNELYLLMKDTVQYKALPAVAAQHVLIVLEKNFKSYFNAIKDWKKLPTKYLGMPKLPNYKDKNGHMTISYPGQTFRTLKNGIVIPKTKISIQTKVTKDILKEVKIVPISKNKVKIEICYEKEISNLNLNTSNVIGIDIGVNNLMAITSNQDMPLVNLINGRPLKSINQYYNKKVAKLKSQLEKCQGKKTSKKLEKLNQKRQNKIDDYLHKASKKVIDLCIINDIGTIIIGRNKEWKQNCNMGKKSNQNFIQIPFGKLIQKINYKGNLVGIETQLHEESYTSKIDHLVGEEMKFHEKYKGKRIKRGLFLSSNGKVINADINGSIGILRKKKAVSESWLTAIGNRGCVYQPIKINIL